ncbi:MAG TPA: methyl-accepting chemotaxis protein [Clostridiales bacterium UBA8960]|nr:methyl-accepting chemotaxis protein [Clostridiales bacterium UBA8960]
MNQAPQHTNTGGNMKSVHSVKMRLFVIPLVVTFFGVLIIGILSSYFTRESLMNEMRDNGYFVSEQIIERMADNQAALVAINRILDEKIMSIANEVIVNRNQLNSSILQDIAIRMGAQDIYWYDQSGKIVYSTKDSYIDWVATAGNPVHDFMISSETERIEADIRKDTESDSIGKNGYKRAFQGYFVQVVIDAKEVAELTERFSYQTLIDNVGAHKNIDYVLVMDTSATVLASNDPDEVGEALEDEGSIAGARDGIAFSGLYTEEDTGLTSFDIVYPVVIDGVHIGAVNIGYSMSGVELAIRNNILIVAIAGIIVFLILSAMLFVTSNGAIAMITALNKHFEVLSSGDFSREVPNKVLDKKDEFGGMARAVERMQHAVSDMIKSVNQKSEQVASASEMLMSTSEQASTAAEEVTKAINEIATGASEQAKDTVASSDRVSQMGELVKRDHVYIQELNSAAQRIVGQKNDGFVILKELVAKTEQNSQSAALIYDIIRQNNENAEQIEMASAMIQSIADQTNLLALNAAIEAARAGEAGRGFAVVADEIRKLAEQSNNFTSEIKKVIDSLKNRSREAVTTMDGVRVIVEAQHESVNSTEARFSGIAEAIDQIKVVIDKLNHSSKDMSSNISGVISLTEALSSISEENAASTEEASAAMEEQTATMMEIATSGQQLAEVAQELQALIAAFKV